VSDADSQANWHWAEGIRFALEGVKLLFVLNGAASISILTFIGNVRMGSGLLVGSLVAFALGAGSTIPAMLLAYLTQLHYGNASVSSTTDLNYWETAGKYHYRAYFFMGLGLVCFLTGVGLAAFGLWQVPSTLPCPVHL
jgi:hypothetical protein